MTRVSLFVPPSNISAGVRVDQSSIRPFYPPSLSFLYKRRTDPYSLSQYSCNIKRPSTSVVSPKKLCFRGE